MIGRGSSLKTAAKNSNPERERQMGTTRRLRAGFVLGYLAVFSPVF